MSFIIFIIFVILLLFFFFASVILSLVGNVLSMLGFGRKKQNNSGGTSYHQARNDGWSSHDNSRNAGTKDKKILFGKDEGEYVDFEEIKDGER